MIPTPRRLRNICPGEGKQIYPSFASARRASVKFGSRVNDRELEPYRCPSGCGRWHIGHSRKIAKGRHWRPTRGKIREELRYAAVDRKSRTPSPGEGCMSGV